jgi:hypothetical protein
MLISVNLSHVVFNLVFDGRRPTDEDQESNPELNELWMTTLIFQYFIIYLKQVNVLHIDGHNFSKC